jgi:Lipopolysaccharide kinase (Kdo/WaaP) family
LSVLLFFWWWPRLKVLLYIPGETAPREVPARLFITVANELQRVHREGVCHGDVRLFNVLYQRGEEPRAQLLDLDHSCSPEDNEEWCYPLNWVFERPDTVRPRRARAGKRMVVEHDRYSFGGMMEKCEPAESSTRSDGRNCVSEWYMPSRPLGHTSWIGWKPTRMPRSSFALVHSQRWETSARLLPRKLNELGTDSPPKEEEKTKRWKKKGAEEEQPPRRKRRSTRMIDYCC